MEDDTIYDFQLGFLESFKADEVLTKTSLKIDEYKKKCILLIHPPTLDQEYLNRERIENDDQKTDTENLINFIVSSKKEEIKREKDRVDHLPINRNFNEFIRDESHDEELKFSDARGKHQFKRFMPSSDPFTCNGEFRD